MLLTQNMEDTAKAEVQKVKKTQQNKQQQDAIIYFR